MSFPENMTLYERITQCTLAMKYTYGENNYISSYDDVMKYSPPGDIHDKIKTIIQDGFKTPSKRDQEAKILAYITIELSKDTKKVIVIEFYKRLKHVDDFEMKFIKNIFNFSAINDEALSILDGALSSDITIYPRIRKHIRHEFSDVFFSVIVNNIKKGVPLDDLGYKIHITKDQLGNLKNIVHKCMPVMIRRWGSCFLVDYFTCEDKDNFSRFSFNKKTIDVNSMKPSDLLNSLNTKDKNREFFIEALFSIMSHTYTPIIKTYKSLTSNEVKDFFTKSVIGKGQSKNLKLLNETLMTKEVVTSSFKIEKIDEKLEKTDKKVEHLSDDVNELKKRIGILEEKIRIDREQIKKLIFEKADLSASRRDLSEQLDRKRKFCSENHECKNTRKEVKITKFDLFDL